MSALPARRNLAVALRVRGGRARGAVRDVPSRRERLAAGDLQRRMRGGDRLGVSRGRHRGRAVAVVLRAAGRRPPRPSLREGRHRPGDLLWHGRSADSLGRASLAAAPVRRPRRRRVRRGGQPVGPPAPRAAPVLDRCRRAHLGDRVCERAAARRADLRRRRAARGSMRVFPRRGPSRRVRAALCRRDREPVRRPPHPRGARHLRPRTGGGALVVPGRGGRRAEDGGAWLALRRGSRGGLSGVRGGRRPGDVQDGARNGRGLVGAGPHPSCGGARARRALRGGPRGGARWGSRRARAYDRRRGGGAGAGRRRASRGSARTVGRDEGLDDPRRARGWRRRGVGVPRAGGPPAGGERRRGGLRGGVAPPGTRAARHPSHPGARPAPAGR